MAYLVKLLGPVAIGLVVGMILDLVMHTFPLLTIFAAVLGLIAGLAVIANTLNPVDALVHEGEKRPLGDVTHYPPDHDAIGS